MAQLRNQLSMIHKVIQTNLNDPLGNVVPADYLYFDSADKLLQSPQLYATFLLWLMSELFEVLPEVGESPLPRINSRFGHPTPQHGVEVERKWKRPEYRIPGNGLVQIQTN